MVNGKFYLAIMLVGLAVLASSCAGLAQGDNKLVSEEDSRQVAEEFVRSSPTFVFDGMKDTLVLQDTLEISIPSAWTFICVFDSMYAGYGDRTGRMLAEVITSHTASVTVEQGKVTYASLDDEWDMVNQKELFAGVDPGSVALPEPDITGSITDVLPTGNQGMHGRIMVETESDGTSDRYVITIGNETQLFMRTGEVERAIGFEILAESQEVEIWLSGPVMESYPAQATAERLVVVTSDSGVSN